METKTSLQDWQQAAEIVKQISRKHKLALYAKAGLIKTQYSSKIYRELAIYLKSDGSLNDLGEFTVLALRRSDQERESERVRKDINQVMQEANKMLREDEQLQS